MKLRLVLNIMVAALVATTAWADTRSSAEMVALMQIGNAMKANEELGGTTPTNWTSLMQIYNVAALSRNAPLNSPVFPLQKHYLFAPPGLWMPETVFTRGEVKIIAANPTRRGNDGLGRHVLVRFTNEESKRVYSRTWISEDKVQTMLKVNRITLPKPDESEVRAAEEAARKYRAEQAELNSAGADLAWQIFIRDLPSRIRSWFVTPANPASVGTPSSTGAQLKFGPIALALLALTGASTFIWRWFVVRRRPTASHTHLRADESG